MFQRRNGPSLVSDSHKSLGHVPRVSPLVTALELAQAVPNTPTPVWETLPPLFLGCRALSAAAGQGPSPA